MAPPKNQVTRIHPPLPNTAVVAYVCIQDGEKFVALTALGATYTARTGAARQRAMIHCLNMHRMGQELIVEEFVYTSKDEERYALEQLKVLNRYHHRWCGELLQNLEDVMTHRCKEQSS